MEKTVLAIDPGTHKCGMALVHRDSETRLHIIWNEIVETDTLLYKLHEAFAVSPYELVILGGGTHSPEIINLVRKQMPSMGVLVVDEAETSLQARERYWEFNPRRGLKRLIPSTLLTPPVPIDDYVAFILAERVLLGSPGA
jgi:RNase H-fold protein (predicted Holliday junction resolvase)